MKKSPLVKTIIAFSAIIAALSLYLLFYFAVPVKPLAGTGGSEKIGSLGGEFELIDQGGQKFTRENLKGSLSLIYFGFTYCPDICPYSLNKLTRIIEVLDKYSIETKPIFITIDPERDRVEILQPYLKNFHGKFIGLTGSKESVKKVAELFKVYYAKSSGSAGQNNYMMDHSSFIYLMDKKGDCVKIFGPASTEEEIIEFIRTWAK